MLSDALLPAFYLKPQDTQFTLYSPSQEPKISHSAATALNVKTQSELIWAAALLTDAATSLDMDESGITSIHTLNPFTVGYWN